MKPQVYSSEDGYSIRGLEPADAALYPGAGLMIYKWALEIGLREKDRDLAKGLDKNGKPFRPISRETRRNRRSEMTPSGKGDPNAPPLIPGWQKSRTRSLLTGRAFTDHVAFWWKYDAHTFDSWARILEYQRETYGRDAFGLGSAALGRVVRQITTRWERWKNGRYTEKVRQPARPAPVIRAGSYEGKYAVGMTERPEIAAGQHAGFMTIEEWTRYFRQTATAQLPGRPLRPRAMHATSGPDYNRLLNQIWNAVRGAPPDPMPIKIEPPSPKLK